MSVEILDFYKRAVPRGDPFVRSVAWTGSVTSTLTVDTTGEEATPTDWTMLIDKISIVASNDFALSGGDKIVITGWDVNPVEIADLSDLMALCDKVNTFKTSADFDRVHGVINPKPPIKLSETDSDVLTIANSAGETQTVTGSLYIVVSGWKVSTTDY